MASEGSMIRIPPDIKTNILSHLPAKSPGRFRCVSKDWLSLISEPQFIKTHHNININTHKRCYLIFVSYELQLYSLQIPSHEAKPVLQPTKIPFKYRFWNLTIQGSCHGLVLVSGHNFESVHVVVLNPTTGESVRFQHPIMRKIDHLFEVEIMYGFGYDSLTRDYKVVTISYYDHNYYEIRPKNICVHVYSLRTNTWRRITDFPYDHSCWKSVPAGVFVDGFLHWLGNKGFDNNLPAIVAFSLAKEKFSELPWPNLDDTECRKDFKLVVAGGKLAIFSIDEIWLMNEYGVRESWTKVVLHGLDAFPRQVEPLSYNDSGKILLANKKLLLIHDIRKRTSRNISQSMNDLKIRGTYVESLVSPKFF